MKEINEREKAILLAALDNELNLKCMEIKESKAKKRLNKIFFLSCLSIVFIFLIQIFFKVFNLRLIYLFLLYQAIALVVLVPFLLGALRSGYKNE